MIVKLFKYDFKALLRYLFPIYGVMLVFAVLFAISLKVSINSEGIAAEVFLFRSLDEGFDPVGMLQIISFIGYVGFVIATVLITAMMVIWRFYKNLLGNEGYMMFALPINTFTHIAEKILSAFVWTIISGITMWLSVIIIVVGILGFNFKYISQGLAEIIRQISANDLWGIIFAWGGLFIIGIIAGIVKMYAAVVLGQRWSDHKILGIFLAYTGFSILENILSRIFLNTSMFFDENFFYVIHIPLYIITIISIIGYALVTWLILEKSLNLE